MRTCLNCGQAADKEAKFCQKCGAPLPVDFDETSEFSKTPPRWVLSLQSGAASEGLINIALQARTRIGRAAESEITLNSKNISRNHSVIEYSPAGFTIRDMKSTNGTLVNGMRITETTRLGLGDKVEVGEFQFLVLAGDPHGQIPPGGIMPVATNSVVPSIAQTFAMPTQPERPAPVPPVQPLPGPPAAAVKKKKKKARQKRKWWQTCLILLALSACGLLTLGGAGYYLFASGAISRRAIQNAVGLGAAEIAVTNLREETVRMRIEVINPETNDWGSYHSEDLDVFVIGGAGGIQPGRMRLILEVAGGEEIGTCTMEVGSGDQYTFVVVPEGVAVAKDGYEPTDANELKLATSSLCNR